MSLEERVMLAVEELIKELGVPATPEVRRVLAQAWLTGRGEGLQDSIDMLREVV